MNIILSNLETIFWEREKRTLLPALRIHGPCYLVIYHVINWCLQVICMLNNDEKNTMECLTFVQQTQSPKSVCIGVC